MQAQVVLMAAILGAATLNAQLSDASIAGTVVDPQGAPVPGVRVTALHLETGVKSASVTNNAGFYSIRPLPIGRYTLSAELAGFRRYQQREFTLTTGQNMEFNIKLELARPSQI